jgi:hypothetical protein
VLAADSSHTNACDQTSDTYHVFEIAHDAIQADAEAGDLEFLCCGRPFHVDAACVADECFAHVEAEATEEQDELRDC